jgi:hypothetical protein
MALKTGIFSLALGALLLGSTAQADDNQFQTQHYGDEQAESQGFRGGYRQDGRWNDHDREYGRPVYGHTHGSDCYHGAQPVAPQNQQGRYELRLVQQWVPGRYEQVWVPQDCRYKPRWGTTKCRGGYYDQRWVEGHYQTAEQWVWVPSRWNRNSGPEWTTQAGHYYSW